MLNYLKSKIFGEKDQKFQWEIDAELEVLQAEQAMKESAQEIAALMSSSGWQRIEVYFQAKIRQLQYKLEKEDDLESRAEIKAIRSLKSYLESQIAHMQ